MSEIAAIITALLAVVIALAAIGAVIGAWVWAVGDLLWMLILKPRLIGGLLAGLVFLVLAAGLALVPADKRVGAYLPLLAAGVLAPIAARLAANAAARREFALRSAKYAFAMDAQSLRQASLFHLVKAQQKALYAPPQAQATPTSGSTG
ncbi:hypothetical protein [Caulobacter soli]|uniref:hypothetical protein n=1 Tax=Caulobacter soli TaxID=2708539 RepID=UPI0013EBB735|nr:hypothetical protein [Caulobacter soli]